ncbi:MAG: IspD/TarI family cytidylyltransferase [Planctomycetia bacterium]|nr:IspD/TarI family cytidylyltransferase [Planctomycetia bacterium]
MEKFAVIIVAAGKSQRFLKGNTGLDHSFLQKKPFALLKGRAVWLHSVQKFSNRREVKQIILVAAPDDKKGIEQKYAADLSFLGIDLVEGGSERFQSVENGLKILHEDIDYVAVHDAVRPCISDGLIESVFDSARKYGAAIPAAPIHGTIKRAIITGEKEQKSELERVQEKLKSPPSEKKIRMIKETVPREDLWEAQTPQVFRKDLILRAYRERTCSFPTDDAQLLEDLGIKAAIVPSNSMNIKITTAQDLLCAEKFLDLTGRKTGMGFFS